MARAGELLELLVLGRGGYELGRSAVSAPLTLRSARCEGMSGVPMAVRVTTISPENPSEAIRTLLAIIVEHAGGDFVGIQDASPKYGLPAYVLFNHPKHRSTLALRLDEHFSTEAVLRRLAECDKKFSRHRPSG